MSPFSNVIVKKQRELCAGWDAGTGVLSFMAGRNINRLIDPAVPQFLRLYPQRMMDVYKVIVQ